MQSVGQGWLALQLSNSAFVVGLVAASAALPVLLLSLYAGVIADRNDKLRLVTIGQALLLVQAVLLWWLVWSGHATVGWLIAFALASGIINSFEIPARQSVIVDLVVKEDLTDAIALNSGGFNLARVIGPSIAGIVINRFGLSWCFALNALSYLPVLYSLLSIKLPKRTYAAAAITPLQGLKEGLAYMIRTREVSVLMRMVAVSSIFSAPYLALMPVIARDVLRSGAAGYGVLLTCVGIGGFAGALGLATVGQRYGRGVLLEYGSYAFAALLIAFSLSRSLHLSAALLLGVGFMMIVSSALANGLLQTMVPDELRGRMMAAYSWVVVGIGPVIGPFVAGAAAKAVGAAVTVGVGGAVTLLYTLWAFAKRPELREL